MGIEVKRKTGETTRSLLRRFTRRIQQSGILIRARKSRFLERKKSKSERRASALRRNEIIREKEKLRKLGLLEEETKFSRRK